MQFQKTFVFAMFLGHGFGVSVASGLPHDSQDTGEGILLDTTKKMTSADVQTLANQIAFRSVQIFGCPNFEENFKSEIAPLYRQLRLQTVKRIDSNFMKKLIWEYAKKKYGKYDTNYEITTKHLIGLSKIYLDQQDDFGPLENEQFVNVVDQIDRDQPKLSQESSCKIISKTEENLSSTSTRELLNRILSRTVNEVGCSVFSKDYNSNVKPLVEELRQRQDWSPSQLQNILWDYSFRKYGEYNSAYHQTSREIETLIHSMLKEDSNQVQASIDRLTEIGQNGSIQCGVDSKSKKPTTTTPINHREHQPRKTIPTLPDIKDMASSIIPPQILPTHGHAKDSSYWSQRRNLHSNGFANRTWGSSLDRILEEKFDHGHLNGLLNARSDLVREFCPRFSRMSTEEKKDFWKVFFKAVAYGESGFDKNSGPKSGIFQLTCDSNARRYYHCKCSSNKDLVDDRRLNLDCAANIVDYWARRGQLFQESRTQTTYFATLLHSDRSYRRNVKPFLLEHRPESCVSAK